MKKIASWMATILLSVYILTTITSCKKEIISTTKAEDEMMTAANSNKQLPFKGSFSTGFQFVPDFANGWTPPNPAPAWYPGSGSGNLTHIGEVTSFFNQYATFGAGGLQSVAAPVNMFFATALGLAGYTPPNSVSTIYFNAEGQSIWSTAVGASFTIPVSPTRVEFTAQHNIIGGTGRFPDATGAYTLSGFFNPQNPNDAGFTVDGWIRY